MHKLPLLRLGLAFVLACSEKAPPPPPPVEVVVAPVEQRDVAITSEWLGTTEGAVDAVIRAQVSGYLISRDYQEGNVVKAGQLLFRIDPRTFQAALQQAAGELGRASAERERARQDVERYGPLVAEGAVSRQEYDNAVQRELGAKAEVLAAEAALETARIELSFSEIRAPIGGIAGVAVAQIGDLVGPADPQPLTAVSQVDPIRVAFPLSEREYLRFADRVKLALERGSFPKDSLQLVLVDGSIYPHRGTGIPAGREVDPSTGTIMVKGDFPNPELLLRPGQYARVRVVTDRLQGALVVPQRAVQELQGTYQVAVVKPDDTVEMRVVQPGPRDGSDQVIQQGLQAGERVVVEGLQKVRNGTAVKPKAVEAAGAS